MIDMKKLKRPTLSGLIAGAIVIIGFALTAVDWGFIALVGLGTFGPGILREFGWLRDRDEFQMQAARRAGYHGFLAAGMIAFLLTAYYRSHADQVGDPGAAVELVLAVLWFTWLLSSLHAYWGPRGFARRILLIFGGAWLVFVLLESLGERSLPGFLMGSLITLPFFAMVWLGSRMPRTTGALLLVFSVAFVYFFGLYRIVSDPFVKGRVMVVIFFVGPLVSAGCAFFKVGSENERIRAFSGSREPFR